MVESLKHWTRELDLTVHLRRGEEVKEEATSATCLGLHFWAPVLFCFILHLKTSESQLEKKKK